MLQVISLLLFLILAVMLFGADVVKGGIGLLVIIAIVVAIVVVLFRVAKEGVTGVQASAREAREKGHAWLWKYPMALGIVWLLAVYFDAYVTAGTMKGPTFDSALKDIPYWWGGPALIGAAFLLRIIESAPNWIPKVPSFFIQIGLLLAAPIILPRMRWVELEMERRDGIRVGTFRMGWEVSKGLLLGLYSFLLGILAVSVLLGIGMLVFLGLTGQL